MTKSTKITAIASEAAPTKLKKSVEEKIAATAAATENRKRFSFGKVWNAAVIAGTVTDHAKLVEQAVKLKVNARSDAKRLKFETLRQKVAAALLAAQENAANEVAE